MFPNRARWAAVTLACVCGAKAVAQQYGFRHYGAAEGLQNLAVLSLAQDGAGYIWAGSEGGLYRYDGTRFHLMGAAEGLPCATEVHTLHVAPDGSLWANTCARLFRFDGKRFAAIGGLNGMLSGTEAMANTADGRVMVGTPLGLYQVLPDHRHGWLPARPYPLGSALAGQPVRGVFRRGSELWFGCGRRLCVEAGGKISLWGPRQGLPEDNWDAIQAGADGSVWVRSPGKLYSKPPRAARFVQVKADLASSMFWGALTILRDGSVMAPTDQGVAVRREGAWQAIGPRQGLPSEIATAVLEDSQGSVWIGMIGGVARWLGYGEWEAWTKAQGLPSSLIWAIRRDHKGALWVGTSLGIARMDGRKPIKTWTRATGLPGENVRWLGETPDHAMWAILKPGGLVRIDPVTDKIRPFGPASGLACATLHRGLVDHLARLWVATGCGVFRSERPSESGHFSRIEQPASLLKSAWAIAEDRGGTVWITNPDGLWRLQEGHWRQYRKSDGLLTDDPNIAIVASDGALWLRHRFDAGIDRVEFPDGRIVRAAAIVPADARSVEVTDFHGFDTSGRFWRGSANGVAVLDRGVWNYATTADGLIWNDCDGEAFWADSDGSVWIGTSGGLAHYRPRGRGLAEPVIANPIITGLTIAEPPRLVRAEFSSLNFKSEQLVRFEYRADGGSWIETGERAISIAGLSAGRHRLEIRSRVRDGPLSPQPALVEFRLQPFLVGNVVATRCCRIASRRSGLGHSFLETSAPPAQKSRFGTRGPQANGGTGDGTRQSAGGEKEGRRSQPGKKRFPGANEP